eukprot:6343966-Pyramimonas_sp.AAC.1
MAAKLGMAQRIVFKPSLVAHMGPVTSAHLSGPGSGQMSSQACRSPELFGVPENGRHGSIDGMVLIKRQSRRGRAASRHGPYTPPMRPSSHRPFRFRCPAHFTTVEISRKRPNEKQLPGAPA